MNQQAWIDVEAGTITVPIKDYAALVEAAKSMTDEEYADTVFKLTNRIGREARVGGGDFRTLSAIHDHITDALPKAKSKPLNRFPSPSEIIAAKNCIVFPSGRNTGKTLRQMVAAPKGAYFIWCNDQAVLYAKNLARYLGRDDLIIVGFSYLQDKNFRGRGPMTIVVDHAADISKVDSFAIYWLLENSTARVSP